MFDMFTDSDIKNLERKLQQGTQRNMKIIENQIAGPFAKHKFDEKELKKMLKEDKLLEKIDELSNEKNKR